MFIRGCSPNGIKLFLRRYLMVESIGVVHRVVAIFCVNDSVCWWYRFGNAVYWRD